MATKTKLAITRSIFKLEAQNFAYKQILTAYSHSGSKKMVVKKQNEENSVNFHARSSRFCMVVHINLPQKNGKKSPTKWPPKINLSMTQSIFKLEAPYFAWQFIMALHNFFCQKKNELSMIQSIFTLKPPYFSLQLLISQSVEQPLLFFFHNFDDVVASV